MALGGPAIGSQQILTGDIEIGAVEIKNPSDDTRATVGANGLYVDVRAMALPTGASTAALQTTGNSSLSSIDGKLPALGQALAAASVPVVLTAAQISTLTPLSTVAATQSGTWTVQPGNTANTTAWKVDASSVAVPVTDNSGSLTVDAPVGTPAFVRLSDGAAAITTLPVSLASVPSHAVTNAGTFVVQENGSALTALQLIDDTVVAQATALGTTKVSLVAGSVTTVAPTFTTGQINELSLTTSGALRVDLGATSANGTAIKVDGSAVTQPVSGTVSITANSAVNVAQINGVTPLMGNGITGTGSQRVTIASDNTAFAVNATLSAETTKVIGTVNVASAQTIAVTNAGTFATQATLQTGTNSVGKISDITTSVVPGTAATNLGKAEDAGHTTGDTGVLSLAVRQAANAPLSGTDLDYEPLQTDANGHLKVNIIDALPAGTNGIGKLTSNAGVTIGAVEIAAAQTLSTVTTVSTVSALGVSTTGPQKAEDVAHASGDMGIAVWAVRDDTIGATSGTEGDYEALHTNENGALWIEPSVSTKGGWSVGNFTSGDSFTALTATAQVLKASAGKFGGYYIYNPNAAATYVHIYNVAAASVTVGTTAALMTFCIPATGGANIEILAGIPFDTAMSIAATTTGGGNTAPTTALECLVFYK